MAKKVAKKAPMVSTPTKKIPAKKPSVNSVIESMGQNGYEDSTEMGSGVPDGTYHVQFESITPEHSKSGRPQITFKMVIATGDHAGKILYNRRGVGDTESIGWFRGDMKKLGQPLPKEYDAEAIQDAIEALVGGYAEVTVLNKDEWANVRFIKPVDESEVGIGLDDDDVPEAEEPEDEVEAEETDEVIEWKKGDEVVVEIDGEPYTGKITKLGKTEHTVKFDDGDVSTIAIGELMKPGEDEAEEEEDESGTEGGVTITFKLTDIKPPLRKNIVQLATDNGYDPDDYDDYAKLLVEIADAYDITGEFDAPIKLYNAVLKAAK